MRYYALVVTMPGELGGLVSWIVSRYFIPLILI